MNFIYPHTQIAPTPQTSPPSGTSRPEYLRCARLKSSSLRSTRSQYRGLSLELDVQSPAARSIHSRKAALYFLGGCRFCRVYWPRILQNWSWKVFFYIYHRSIRQISICNTNQPLHQPAKIKNPLQIKNIYNILFPLNRNYPYNQNY